MLANGKRLPKLGYIGVMRSLKGDTYFAFHCWHVWLQPVKFQNQNLCVNVFVCIQCQEVKKSELLKRRLLCFSNNCLRANPDKCHHCILKKAQSKTKCPVWSVGKRGLLRSYA